MIWRLLVWLRLGHLLPRCGAEPPWRLADEAGTCFRPSRHETSGRDDADWHADGYGFVWNDVLGQWRWMGDSE